MVPADGLSLRSSRLAEGLNPHLSSTHLPSSHRVRAPSPQLVPNHRVLSRPPTLTLPFGSLASCSSAAGMSLLHCDVVSGSQEAVELLLCCRVLPHFFKDTVGRKDSRTSLPIAAGSLCSPSAHRVQVPELPLLPPCS